MYDNFFVLDHPLIQHKITMLRDYHTGTSQFRALIQEIATLMGYEVLRDLPLEDMLRLILHARLTAPADDEDRRNGIDLRMHQGGKRIHGIALAAVLHINDGRLSRGQMIARGNRHRVSFVRRDHMMRFIRTVTLMQVIAQRLQL